MTTPQEKALQLHEQYGAHFAQIRANTALSEEGKAQQIAPAYVDYRNKLAEIADAASTATARRKQDLIRTAFGVPSDPIAAMSYRDALGRAEQIEDAATATYKLNDALETGDALLAKALAKKAADNGWTDTLNTYTTANPQAGSALAELTQMQAAENSVQQMFMTAAHMQPQVPSELAGMTGYQIDAIANPDLPDSDTAAANDFAAALHATLYPQQPAPSAS